MPTKSKDKTLPLVSRDSFKWIKYSLCLVNVQGAYNIQHESLQLGRQLKAQVFKHEID